MEDPKTLAERRAVAAKCREALGLAIPFLVDGMDDAANIAYAAWPERLYVIGEDGRIAYAGGVGPFHFKPDEMAEFLEKHLADPSRRREGGVPPVAPGEGR